MRRYRSSFFRLASAALALIAVGALTRPWNPPQARAAGSAPDYSGLYIATLPLIDARRAPPADIYAVREAEGVYIRTVWNQVEPSPGRYDWSLLDPELDRAV